MTELVAAALRVSRATLALLDADRECAPARKVARLEDELERARHWRDVLAREHEWRLRGWTP